MNLRADSKDPDQTAHMRRSVWTFAVRICPKIDTLSHYAPKCSHQSTSKHSGETIEVKIIDGIKYISQSYLTLLNVFT